MIDEMLNDGFVLPDALQGITSLSLARTCSLKRPRDPLRDQTFFSGVAQVHFSDRKLPPQLGIDVSLQHRPLSVEKDLETL